MTAPKLQAGFSLHATLSFSSNFVTMLHYFTKSLTTAAEERPVVQLISTS